MASARRASALQHIGKLRGVVRVMLKEELAEKILA